MPEENGDFKEVIDNLQEEAKNKTKGEKESE